MTSGFTKACELFSVRSSAVLNSGFLEAYGDSSASKWSLRHAALVFFASTYSLIGPIFFSDPERKLTCNFNLFCWVCPPIAFNICMLFMVWPSFRLSPDCGREIPSFGTIFN